MTELWTQIAENLSFVLTCLALVVGLALLAKLAERFLPERRKVTPARRVSIIGICAAIATVLHVLDFSIPFLAPGFYKLDFSELPVLLCGFYLGPCATVVCEGIKILLKLLLKGTSTAFVGDFANFFVGCAMVLPAAVIYHRKKSKKTAIIGLVAGTVVMAAVGSAFNAFYLIPKFSQLFGIPLDVIVGMGADINSRINSVGTLALFCVVPFNIVKGVVVSFLTLLLYKRVEKVFFRDTIQK